MEKFKAEKEPTSSELRKINKPLMEKKRRERINSCLDQLKHFLIEATKRDSSYYSKLEKADILEMTVKYLKSIQTQQLQVAIASEPGSINKYTAGYNECAAEVGRYLGNIDGLSPDIKTRMQSHLNNCLTQVKTSIVPNTNRLPPQQTVHLGQPMNIGIQMPGPSQDQMIMSSIPSAIQQAPSATPLASLPGMASTSAAAAGSQYQATTQQHQNLQNVPIVPAQLVPAKLPTGEIVLLLANAQGISSFQPMAQASNASSMGTVNPFILNSPQYTSPLATSSPVQSRSALQHQSSTFSPPFSAEQSLKVNKNEHHKSPTSTITRDPNDNNTRKLVHFETKHFETKHFKDANQNIVYESDNDRLKEERGPVSHPLPLNSNSPPLQHHQQQHQQQEEDISNDPVWRPW